MNEPGTIDKLTAVRCLLEVVRGPLLELQNAECPVLHRSYVVEQATEALRALDVIAKVAGEESAASGPPGPPPLVIPSAEQYPVCDERCESDWVTGDVRCSLPKGHDYNHVFGRRVG